ncbi:nicotinate-nucleotide--dimethylbenzimidazole phosphoribosyltransferase [Tistrella mobilis]
MAADHSTIPFKDLAGVAELVRAFPGPDEEAMERARARDAELTKPRGALGRLEELAVWTAAWQAAHPPRAARPLACVFAGNHGIAERGVSAYPASVTEQMVANFVEGGAAVNQLCRSFGAGLSVYEMGLDQPTADFTRGPALEDAEVLRAIAFGMRAVEPGIDILCLGEMGIGNTTAGSAIAAALFGGMGSDWAGRGTGVDDAGLARKIAVIDEALGFHGPALADPLQVLRRLGGHELAAIVGAVIAARMLRVPVLLDGFTCTAAAAVLWKLDPAALDHCRIAHLSREPGHQRLAAAIGQRPLLDLDMALGEASGAVLASALVQAAIATHNGMATFAEAGVSTASD